MLAKKEIDILKRKNQEDDSKTKKKVKTEKNEPISEKNNLENKDSNKKLYTHPDREKGI